MFDRMQLRLMIGPTVPVPAPFDVIDAISSITVTNNDSGRDGFQLNFTMGRNSPLDYDLLLRNYFEPPNRVIIIVILGVLPYVLIDGIITNHQLAPSNIPGGSTLTVTGEDVSLKLDLEEKSETYPNQADSDIVNTILGRYGAYNLVPVVTTTPERPQQNQRITTQQGTDLTFIQELARRNGFIFYIEPRAPRVNTAYFGVPNFTSPSQSALTLAMGPNTNVESLSFTFNALGPTTPQVTIVEPNSRIAIQIPVPSGLRPPLALRPTTSLRRTLPRETANLDQSQARLVAAAGSTQSADAVTGSGQLNVVRYGSVLRARRLVDVRGVGASYDGRYYVKQVTHQIKRGEYKQNFSISREGRGALQLTVVT